MAKTMTRARRRAAAAVGLVAALAGGACAARADGPDVTAVGGDVGEFAATTEYLSGVALATDGLSYRVSADVTMRFRDGSEEVEIGGDFMTGEVDGDLSSSTFDMGEMFDDLARQEPGAPAPRGTLADADATIEMVADGATLYLRAPLYASMAEIALDAGASADDLGPLADLAALGDGWARVDTSRLSPSEVARAGGAQWTDPRAFLDMATNGTDVHDLGGETIDGVEARGLGATITYGDMLAAQDMDADDLRDSLGSTTGSAGEALEELWGEEVIDRLMVTEMPIEVWVDDDDRVRRISSVLDMTETIEAASEAAGGDLGEGGFAVTTVVDFSDYGDDTIEIEVPTDAVDVTDVYLDLIDGRERGWSPFGTT